MTIDRLQLHHTFAEAHRGRDEGDWIQYEVWRFSDVVMGSGGTEWNDVKG